MPTCRVADPATCRHADLPTLRPAADLPTCRPADLPTCRRADLPTCRLADLPFDERKNAPTLDYGCVVRKPSGCSRWQLRSPSTDLQDLPAGARGRATSDPRDGTCNDRSDELSKRLVSRAEPMGKLAQFINSKPEFVTQTARLVNAAGGLVNAAGVLVNAAGGLVNRGGAHFCDTLCKRGERGAFSKTPGGLLNPKSGFPAAGVGKPNARIGETTAPVHARADEIRRWHADRCETCRCGWGTRRARCFAPSDRPRSFVAGLQTGNCEAPGGFHAAHQ